MSFNAIPKSALVLGLAGAIPFVAFAAARALGWPTLAGFPVTTALLGYGAVILSFLGGIRWGSALNEPDGVRQGLQLTLSVVPSLVAWAALLMPPERGLVILLFGVIAQGVSDAGLARTGQYPAWFGRCGSS